MTRPRDPAALRRQLVAWLRDRVREVALRGCVIGLSGGIDSAVVLGLAAEAVGPERCLALILPLDSAEEDVRLAEQVADRFDVPPITVDLEDPFRALLDALTRQRERVERLGGGTGPAEGRATPAGGESSEALATANLKPRLRMTALYYYANLLDYLVLGTSNRSERTVGYFTKWGDGAADALPIADLVKQEVRALARVLGVPEAVVRRPPSAGLWPGQTDESELGFGYAQLDRYVLTGSAGDPRVDAAIERRRAGSEHKRSPPPTARPG